ncbi:MAG: hypothetical protein HOO06_12535 [Bdellovibrionaceae bacterium]|jgi:hypothetical protein|nr:hypothetical protein [Pseudobdellovibrionaceae bacterium]
MSKQKGNVKKQLIRNTFCILVLGVMCLFSSSLFADQCLSFFSKKPLESGNLDALNNTSGLISPFNVITKDQNPNFNNNTAKNIDTKESSAQHMIPPLSSKETALLKKDIVIQLAPKKTGKRSSSKNRSTIKKILPPEINIHFRVFALKNDLVEKNFINALKQLKSLQYEISNNLIVPTKPSLRFFHETYAKYHMDMVLAKKVESVKARRRTLHSKLNEQQHYLMAIAHLEKALRVHLDYYKRTKSDIFDGKAQSNKPAKNVPEGNPLLREAGLRSELALLYSKVKIYDLDDYAIKDIEFDFDKAFDILDVYLDKTYHSDRTSGWYKIKLTEAEVYILKGEPQVASDVLTEIINAFKKHGFENSYYGNQGQSIFTGDGWATRRYVHKQAYLLKVRILDQQNSALTASLYNMQFIKLREMGAFEKYP